MLYLDMLHIIIIIIIISCIIIIINILCYYYYYYYYYYYIYILLLYYRTTLRIHARKLHLHGRFPKFYRVFLYVYIYIYIYLYTYVSMYICIHIYIYIYIYIPVCRVPTRAVSRPFLRAKDYGRFPKFHRVFLGRDPGTLKSNIVSKRNIHNRFVRI